MERRCRNLLLAGLGMVAMTIGPIREAPAGETYKLDKDHTEIRFTWDHLGMTTQAGRFLDYAGTLTFDETDPEAAVLIVTIQAASLTTDVPALDKKLRAAEFFDAAKHPEITFKSRQVVQTGAKTGRVTGDLTIRGITKPVTLNVEYNFGGVHPLALALPKYKDTKAVAFSARTEILRSDFGLGQYAPLTSDNVVIAIETELLRRP